MRIVFAAFALLVTFVQPATAQVARSAVVDWLQAGVICAPDSVGFREAPGTITGRSHIIEAMPEFVSLDQIVPSVIGVGFGIRMQAVAGTPTMPVTVTLRHPPMGSDGTQQQTFTSAISGDGPTIAFFQFDHDYERVEGQWSFEARDGDQLIYRAVFQVVPPQDIPQLADICNYRDLLS